jgi:divalent metal cation (Fe/Co/Zn/Cd) transporter
LFATAADSVFDPIANVVLNRIYQKSTNLDKHKWPVGGSRLENAANCVYAFLMASVSLILIVESARDIGSHESTDVETLHIPALIAVGVAFVTKAVLGILNYKFRAFSSQLDMLWEDCRNDLVINGFGLITCATGAKVVWWLDPAGAMIISVGVIIAWGSTAYHQFEELCGITAPPEFIKLAAYNALHLHYHDIVSLESIVAYHSGPKYICEIDIVMRPETSLWKAHDVSQDLQDKIELLPMVERAYIHVDVDVSHKPEHSRKVK